MSLHDDYARVTPFEIAFPDETVLEALVGDVDEEAGSRGVDAALPGIFSTLGSVADFIAEMRGPDAPDEGSAEYTALLYHAVHFHKAGRPLYLLETPAVRRLVEESPQADPHPPSPAGYLQLPQHLVWMAGSGDGAPESVDGLFWFATEHGAVHVLPITAVLPDRGGFRAVPLPEAPLTAASEWLDGAMREGGQDFASALPGHDLDGLYSVETAGEVLKLLARFFAYFGSKSAGRSEGAAEGTEQGPTPSRLRYTRVELVA